MKSQCYMTWLHLSLFFILMQRKENVFNFNVHEKLKLLKKWTIPYDLMDKIFYKKT